ncbi:bifunctional enoyl-CoA hydratase/phosphate acetyltransferase [Biomaibacter acetigenes]|uniref:Bifunctional enoyl-CoA hydratase/phosphate acetyltransferase n=1 Tax=Biomaibacter acetigenes TaxID=2316383 RepID=A0A3G2R724_9FIRM|nr:bifunctional enoyl-CoA hydratase/phosphate acetyltransferase [Biomaibacter acetigenes]AYO31354.1 bifunctional enoyl-CoA hydratase/phosphate acetyltransferase [Biomaibacter acetigenes]
MFRSLGEVIEKLKAYPPMRLCVAQAADTLVLEAVRDAAQQYLAVPILVGEKNKILQEAEKIGFSLEDVEILDCPGPEAPMVAVKLVYEKKADVFMKGMVETSAFLKAVLAPDFGLRKGMLLSHLAAMEVPSLERVIFITDGGINIAPTLEEKAAILQNAVDAVRALGYEEPKAAVLAVVENISTKMQATLDAAILSKMAQRGQITGAVVDGPLALDNALVPQAAVHKKIQSPVAGKADIILAPEILTANTLAKSISFLAGGHMAGVVVGARVPVVLSSRADSAYSKLASIALACLIKRGEEEC